MARRTPTHTHLHFDYDQDIAGTLWNIAQTADRPTSLKFTQGPIEGFGLTYETTIPAASMDPRYDVAFHEALDEAGHMFVVTLRGTPVAWIGASGNWQLAVPTCGLATTRAWKSLGEAFKTIDGVTIIGQAIAAPADPQRPLRRPGAEWVSAFRSDVARMRQHVETLKETA